MSDTCKVIEICVNQTPISGVETGWRIWNAAFVILRYLERAYPPHYFREKMVIGLNDVVVEKYHLTLTLTFM